MAALTPDERCFISASLIFFLANENETGYTWDQCCHLQGDGASLEWMIKFFKNMFSEWRKQSSALGHKSCRHLGFGPEIRFRFCITKKIETILAEKWFFEIPILKPKCSQGRWRKLLQNFTLKKTFFVVPACHYPVLDGFDWHYCCPLL